MRKPRLTDKVIKGLQDAVNLVTADDADDMERSGNISSASAIDSAYKWLTEMIQWRQEQKTKNRRKKP